MTCRDIIMTLSVNNFDIKTFHSFPLEYQKQGKAPPPRGEETMKLKSKEEKCNESHTKLEEENHRKNRIFESYIRGRVF